MEKRKMGPVETRLEELSNRHAARLDLQAAELRATAASLERLAAMMRGDESPPKVPKEKQEMPPQLREAMEKKRKPKRREQSW